ncbi:MAG: fused MFS/spermidine synthase [Gammaproteobacteria bacterium]|nr:fused MFS/spermidine synthase [Gammaproteobacteria bacterium]
MESSKVAALNPITILAVILIEGFVTIAVEMLTIRQLITVVGNSVIITSLIIGIFLLFLAFGYYQGGNHRENYLQVLRNNFTWSSLLLGVGLSYPFIQYFFFYVFQSLSSNALFGLMLYLFLVTAPLVYLLGQTVPITTNLFRHDHHVGSISGKVLGLSTVGSFLGSVLTTIVLMNFFGVAWTVFFNFALLYILILLLTNFRNNYIRLFIITMLGIFVFLLNVSIEKSIFVKTNNYGDYQIVQNTMVSPLGVGNMLNINNSPSSFLTAEKKGFEYIEYIKKILFIDLKFVDKDILVLGAGGFTLSAQSTFGNHFLYVDIDGSLPETVKQGFNDQINGTFIAEDARKFLKHSPKKFDAVVSDVYSSHYTIPFHLLTQEYFQSIQQILNPNGVAIFNIIANPMLYDSYSKRVDNTIRSVFKNCMTVPIPYHNGAANIIYICSAKSIPDKTVYTDNRNPSMIDIFNKQMRS